MRGIGLILPNADFSGSPLGQISIAKSVDDLAYDVVVAYAESIGTSQYNSSLQTLVVDLMNNGLWDKVTAIYPMLGTSLSAKKVNLKSPNSFDLALGQNASVISNGLSFVDTISVSDVAMETINNKFMGYTYYFVGKQIRGKQNMAALLSSADSWIRIGGASNNGLQFYLGRNGVFQFADGSSTNIRKITFHAEETYMYCIADGVKSNNTASSNNYALNFVNGFGFECSALPIDTESNSNQLFSGEMYCAALGWMSEAESIKFDSIMCKFVADLKGL